MKKISVLLVFVLLLSLAASFGVSAETKVISSGVCGDNLTWILYEGEGPGHDRTFVIEGTGDMYDYEFSYFGKEEGSTPEQIPCPWEEETQSIDELVFKGNITKIGSGTFTYTLGGGSSLSKIVIPDGVKSIGEGAFADCRSLSEVIMPNSLESIGAFAFSGCSNLENIIIPDSVTSVGRDAFAGSGLSNVTFSDSIKKIADSMFRDCRMIKDMVIPEGITEIGANAFAGSGLSSVTIPDSVTKIDAYAFKGCRELKHIIIPDSVTSIGDGAFSEYVSGSHECGLRSIVIPESVTDLGDNMFTGATYLVKAEINANITEIPFGLFIWCHKLEDVTLPENITKIGAYAFSNCGSLKSITIPGSVKEIQSKAFSQCGSLKVIHFENGDINVAEDFLAGCSDNIVIDAPKSSTVSDSEALFRLYLCGDMPIIDYNDYVKLKGISESEQYIPVYGDNNLKQLLGYVETDTIVISLTSHYVTPPSVFCIKLSEVDDAMYVSSKYVMTTF